MAKEIKITLHGLRVLRSFEGNSGKALSGADVSRITNLPGGTVYPILYRFEKAGLLGSRWEKGDAKRLKRPLKRLYGITKPGIIRYKFEIANNNFG